MKNKFLKLPAPVVFLVIALAANGQNWSLTGNSSTNPPTNFLGTKDNKMFVFKTNNIERMRINANGKIGIGTTTPQALLSVANSSIATLGGSGSFLIGNQTATNLSFDYKQIQARYNGQGATLFLNQLGGPVWLGSNGSGFPALWTNADGRVGIGTNYALASGYALTVDPVHLGNGIAINDPGNGYSLYAVKSGNNGAAVHIEAKNTYTAAIEAFTHNAQRAIYGEDALNGNGVEGRSYGGNAVVGVSTVNVGILGVAPTYAGYFDGDVYASGTYNGSDQKLKQNINDLPAAMDIINQLHPKHYEYRHDGNYKLMNLPNGEHYGLIAQDVEKILPNLVKDTKFETRYAETHSTEEDIKNSETIDFKALNYTEFIPIIIKGMQEQQEQIDALQKTVQTLLADRSTSSASYNIDYLQQNIPNPFNQNTVINCYVPPSAKQAGLIVCTIEGKQLKYFTLSNDGMNKITINAGTLSAGEYIYSLLLDGKRADSKQMILTR